MNTSAKLLLLSACVACSPTLLQAAPIATLSCQGGQGPALSTAVFFFTADYSGPSSSGLNSAEMAVDVTAFPLLDAATAPLTYSSCTLANSTGSISLSNVSLDSVSANGSGAGVQSPVSDLYTTLSLSFSTLSTSGALSSSGQTSVGTFSCQSSQAPSFSSPVYALTSGSGGVVDGQDIATLATLNAAVASQASYNCTLTAGLASVALTGLTFTSASATGYGANTLAPFAQLVAGSSFVYTTLTISGSSPHPGVSPVATLTCQTAQGSAFASPVYLFADTDFVLDYATYPALAAAAAAQTVYPSCVLDDGIAPITLANAVVSLPTVGPGAISSSNVADLFSIATINYATISVGGVTVPGPTPSATAKGAAPGKIALGAKLTRASLR